MMPVLPEGKFSDFYFRRRTEKERKILTNLLHRDLLNSLGQHIIYVRASIQKEPEMIGIAV